MSVNVCAPQELYVFQPLSASNLRKQCPDQCGDDVNGEECQDPITLDKLKDSTLIASARRSFIGQDGAEKILTTCYDEPGLRAWDVSLAGTGSEPIQPFTDPTSRLPLVWPSGMETPERVARERAASLARRREARLNRQRAASIGRNDEEEDRELLLLIRRINVLQS
jgi:hypothetical protein